MGRKNKKNKSPAPTTPPPAPVDEKDLIAEAVNPLEKLEKKLINDLNKRYPEVKERVSLKQQKKSRKKGSNSSSPNTSNERLKSSGRSKGGDSLSYDKNKPYRQKSKEELKEAEFGWKNVETVGSLPPSDYMITNINQNQDLLRLDDHKVGSHMELNSTEWLKVYGIDGMKLTLKDLLSKGQVSKPVNDKSGKAIQNIKFESNDVNEFEYKLNLALEMFSKRIKWLLQSSRKTFGLVQGKKVAVLIDSSNSNMGFGRSVEIQDSLLSLIDEQLAHKKQLYFLSFGSGIDELWDDSLKDVHHRTLEEAKVFVTELKPSGGSNVLKALRRILNVHNVDSIVLIIGSVPDQSMEIVTDYMYQALLNSSAALHCISYELNNHIVNSTLKKLAEETSGRFHFYSKSNEEMIYNSTDINLLLKEIQKLQDVMSKIEEMKKGMLGSALIQIENEVSLELQKFPQAKFLPRPRGHDLPLRIDSVNSSGKVSRDWIEKHGLKAKRLNLYQILAPNAYSFVENYIPVLNKTVQSQVHEKAMVQFVWHDGTIKNLHIDLATLYDFQNRLKDAVKLYEKRIEWISSGSRKIFGSIAEDTVVILVDLSQSNENYLIHIQHSLRLLMEEQISNKKLFNIIGFSKTIQKWRPTVVKPTPETLQDAWRWVLDLKCQGTRNLLGGLKETLENEEELKHNIFIEGVYIFTSGIPDQPNEILCQYVEEVACGNFMRCHTILFNVDDYDCNGPIPGRWANITKTAESLRILAHCVGGRFHWFREIGIIESDDIKLVQQEIDRAVEFSKKAYELVDSIKKKSKEIEINSEEEYGEDGRGYASDGEARRPKVLPPPKPTALSLQRQQLMKEKEVEESRDRIIEANKQKTLPWRPNSSKVDAVPLASSSNKEGLTRSPLTRSLSAKSRAKTEPFYIDGKGNSKGLVYSKYPTNKSIRKTVPVVHLMDKEENVSTKEWLKRYSLARLKLDLHKLVAGPECKHDLISIGAIKKDVAARYCSIFPSINVNGLVRHLQLKPGELLDYQEQCEKVLARYIKRLQWLLSSSRRTFGTFVHSKIAILIDTSGSMNDFMPEVKKELAALIWEQLFKFRISFNFIQFSDRCEKWRERAQEPTEDNCNKAIAWLASLIANGSTCTLDALEEAFKDPEINAIYLITDGKPDNSTTMVIEEVRKMNYVRNLSINTVSLNCDEKSANDFLKQLSSENSGRYHRCNKSDTDIHLFAHKILTEGVKESYISHIPEFESDDLKRLASEINKAKQFLQQSITFYRMYDKRDNSTEDVVIGPIHLNHVNEHDTRHKGCVPVDFLS